MAKVFLSLGSNVGDREENLTGALGLLAEKGGDIIKLSRFHETEPVGGPPQGKFLNAVVQLETSLSAQALFHVIQDIEQALGRVREVKNGPRTIDVDILLYGRQRIQSAELTVPHPRMLERDFVLIPLQEILPDYMSEYPDENDQTSPNPA